MHTLTSVQLKFNLQYSFYYFIKINFQGKIEANIRVTMIGSEIVLIECKRKRQNKGYLRERKKMKK